MNKEANSSAPMAEDNLKIWLTILACALFYSYQYALRVLPNTLAGEFMEGYNVDAGGLGLILAFYSFAYAGLQIPLGIMLDRVKIRYLLPIAPFICTISTLMLSYCTDIYFAAIARFLMGVGAAFGFIGTVKVATLVLPPKRIGIAIGCVVLCGTFGAGLGGKPLQYLADDYGWREVLRYMSLIGVALSILLFIAMSSTYVRYKQKLTLAKINNSIIKDIKLIIKDPRILFLALYGMLMYLPITILGVGWGIDFIIVYFETDYSVAANAIFLLFIGAGVGGPISAYIAEILGSKQIVMTASALISLLLHGYMVILRPAAGPELVYFYLFCAGALYSAKVLSFAQACEMMPHQVSGLTTSILNMVVMLSGLLFHPLVGMLLSYGYGDNDPEMYAVEDYRDAMLVLPISAFVSFLLSFIMCPSKKDEKVALTAENAFISYDE